MFELFLGHAGARVAEARDRYDAGDLPAVERAAHSVKSSAGNIGAMRLFELAGTLERLASAADLPGAGGAVEEIERAFARVKARIEEHRSVLQR
jgi:HPt (histidine-containing phosphotransfer) domain-containing protein